MAKKNGIFFGLKNNYLILFIIIIGLEKIKELIIFDLIMKYLVINARFVEKIILIEILKSIKGIFNDKEKQNKQLSINFK